MPRRPARTKSPLLSVRAAARPGASISPPTRPGEAELRPIQSQPRRITLPSVLTASPWRSSGSGEVTRSRKPEAAALRLRGRRTTSGARRSSAGVLARASARPLTAKPTPSGSGRAGSRRTPGRAAARSAGAGGSRRSRRPAAARAGCAGCRPTAVPRSPTQPGGGTHSHGALWREARCQRVATWLPPRRVSVSTASATSRPSLMPTPAKPMPSPRVFELAARSW